MKIESLMFKYCHENKQAIVVLPNATLKNTKGEVISNGEGNDS